MPALEAISYDKQRIVRGSLFYTPAGSDYSFNLGSAKAEFEAEIENTDIFSNEFKFRNRLARITVQINGNIKLTLRSMTPAVMALAHMSTPGLVHTQVATASLVKTYTDVDAGDSCAVLDANGKHVFGVNLIESAPVGAVRLDGPAGRVQFLSSQDEVEVTFGVPAITADQKKAFLQFLANGQMQGKLELRQDNALGDNYHYTWPSTSMALSGGFPMIQDGNDVSEVEVTVAINSDPTQPEGLERGWAVLI